MLARQTTGRVAGVSARKYHDGVSPLQGPGDRPGRRFFFKNLRKAVFLLKSAPICEDQSLKKNHSATACIAGFAAFCEQARVEQFDLSDLQVDVAGDVGVASFAFEMKYTRDGVSACSTGRDLWVFRRQGRRWLAVWRTILDLTDEVAAHP